MGCVSCGIACIPFCVLCCMSSIVLGFIVYDYDYDYEMVLLRHTISTMYHGIIFKSCKKHNILQ